MKIERMRTTGFWYLASPYSHPEPEVRAARAAAVLHASGKLLEAGIHVYSPIHATHAAAVEHELPKDHVFWLAFNKAFIDPAVGVVVAGIDGWTASEGVRQEITYAQQAGKPVYLLDDDGTLRAIGMQDIVDFAAIRDFTNDLAGMSPDHMARELEEISEKIEGDTAWQEALAAALRQSRLKGESR
ncbi:DUF1937 family protein [Neorhizobium sp. T786]|uniref:DUF1937 family protein n=1 Tax=Pseudorhizobium xiangyangii TaxID=2883104 RepID=UPI001CFF70D4|nr:DUF1937 family protein [Neorhizobium xiangyangii]MCB5201672.1 DUF1937 family protein [Neorhizobium xiangyangii]